MQEQLKQKMAAYQPSAETIALIQNTPLLLLVGPTGAGKDSLVQELLKTSGYHELVSHTTRPPRINHGILEKDGEHYHFIDLATAERMLDEQAYVEAKMYSGNIYGVSAAEVQLAHDQGKVALNDIEVQGVAEFKKFATSVMAVFLLPPDFDTWQGRLQRRYGDVVDLLEVRVRMHTALSELDQLLTTANYMAVINGDLDEAREEIISITTEHAHDPAKEAAARAVAKKLMVDIELYLATTT